MKRSTQPQHRQSYLDALGIEVWQRRDNRAPEGSAERAAEAAPGINAASAVAALSGAPGATDDWTSLRAAVAGCERCSLHRSRTQTVFGVGDTGADWMIIGEAPGAEEDRRGEPFVGRAGKLLDEVLRAVGLSRERVFIANILKCRPPENRDPAAEEARSCRSYLDRQIELVQPKLILAVGRIAAQQLFETDQPIGKLRGRVHEFGVGRIPTVATYHPAYLLRSPSQKAKVWQDLCLARRTLRQ